jgi:hypothetical protein
MSGICKRFSIPNQWPLSQIEQIDGKLLRLKAARIGGELKEKSNIWNYFLNQSSAIAVIEL